jgi:hypothetical protein
MAQRGREREAKGELPAQKQGAVCADRLAKSQRRFHWRLSYGSNQTRVADAPIRAPEIDSCQPLDAPNSGIQGVGRYPSLKQGKLKSCTSDPNPYTQIHKPRVQNQKTLNPQLKTPNTKSLTLNYCINHNQ